MRQPVQLIFVRHGIAADRETFVGPDAERPLTAEGRKKTTAILNKFVPLYPPDAIITSELLRAHETAELIAQVAQNCGLFRQLPALSSGKGSVRTNITFRAIR